MLTLFQNSDNVCFCTLPTLVLLFVYLCYNVGHDSIYDKQIEADLWLHFLKISIITNFLQ